MTAAVPLVERLAEVLHSLACGRHASVDECESADEYREDARTALLPVVEQAVAEARGEALREYADAVEGNESAFGWDARDIAHDVRDWANECDRADAIATTEGA